MKQGLLFTTEEVKPLQLQSPEPVLEPLRTPLVGSHTIDAFGRFRCSLCADRSGASRCLECRPLRARFQRLAAATKRGKTVDVYSAARVNQTFALAVQQAVREAELDASGIDQVVRENAEIQEAIAPFADKLFALRLVCCGEHMYAVREYLPGKNRKGNWAWSGSIEILGTLGRQVISETMARRISHLTGIGIGGMANTRLTPGELYLLGLGPPPQGLLEVDWRPNEMLPEDRYA
jgi:hypothetical protein